MPSGLLEIKVNRSLKFVNVGEDPPDKRPGWDGYRRRNWNACIEYKFISAGQGPLYRNQICSLEVKDIIAVYITGHGYVALAEVLEKAVMIN